MTCNTQFPFDFIEEYMHFGDFHAIEDIGLKYILHTSECIIDKSLRFDLRNSIDKNKIAAELYHGVIPLDSFFPTKHVVNNESVNKEPTNDWGGKELEMIYSEYYPNEIICLKLKEQWERNLNIKLLLKKLTLFELVDRINRGDFVLALDICMLPLSHPMAVGMFFGGWLPEYAKESMLNYFNDFLEGGKLEIQNIDSLCKEHISLLPLFTLRSFYLLNPAVKDLVFMTDGSVSFSGIHFDAE